MERMARQYGQRPSQLAGISDPYTAYCFDEALYVRGVLAEQAALKTVTPAQQAKAPAGGRIVGGRITGKIGGRIGERWE